MKNRKVEKSITKSTCLFILFCIFSYSNCVLGQIWYWEKIADFHDIPEITLAPNNNIYMSVFYELSAYYRVSSDTGKTWQSKSTGCQDFFSRRIVFNKKNDIFIRCGNNKQSLLLRSTNNEITWDTVYIGAEIFSLFIDKEDFIYIGNWEGKVLASTNNGNSWSENKIASTFVSSFAQSGDGKIYAGTNNGLFFSLNSGKSWIKDDRLGNSYIQALYISKNNCFFRSNDSESFVSYDSGNQWEKCNISSVESYSETNNGRIFACGMDGVFYYDTLDHSWIKISGFTNAVRLLEIGSKLLVSSNSGIYLYDSQKTSYIGKNYFPLSSGNKWQYIIIAHNDVTTNTKYYLEIDSVKNDTIINNKTYFKTLGEPDLWLRYSDSEKKAYAYADNKDNLFMDFSLNDGSILNQYCGGTDTRRDVKIQGGYTQLFNKSVHYKEFKYFYSFGTKGGVITTTFGENIGPISQGIGYNLIQAVVRDGNDTNKFTYHNVPKIKITPVYKVDDYSFNLDFEVSHAYSLISLSYYYGDNEVNFIDTVKLIGFYKNGENIIKITDIGAKRTVFTSKYNLNFPLDKNLLNSGFSFYYKIYAKDRGIITEDKYSPDTGFYKLDYSPLTVNQDKNAFIRHNYKLEQCYPNPFNNSSSFFYYVPKESFVNITLYNGLGQALKVIVNENKLSGSYKAHLDCSFFPSGIYYYRMISTEFSEVRKFILLK